MPARGTIHIAVMERHGIRSILSFDVDFDRWPGLQKTHGIWRAGGRTSFETRATRCSSM